MQSAVAIIHYFTLIVMAVRDHFVAGMFYQTLPENQNRETSELEFALMWKDTYKLIDEYAQNLLFGEPRRTNYEVLLHQCIQDFQKFTSLEREAQIRFICWMFFQAEVLSAFKKKWQLPLDIFRGQSDKMEEYYVNCSRIVRLLPRVKACSVSLGAEISKWQMFCYCLRRAAIAPPPP
nr:expressed protein [Hymenolepis microstoma]